MQQQQITKQTINHYFDVQQQQITEQVETGLNDNNETKASRKQIK